MRAPDAVEIVRPGGSRCGLRRGVVLRLDQVPGGRPFYQAGLFIRSERDIHNLLKSGQARRWSA